jgi:hypothetical protein
MMISETIISHLQIAILIGSNVVGFAVGISGYIRGTTQVGVCDLLSGPFHCGDDTTL